MRRRLSGKVENDGLLLRVLRSSGQLTLFVVETITKSKIWNVDEGGHQDVEVAA